MTANEFLGEKQSKHSRWVWSGILAGICLLGSSWVAYSKSLIDDQILLIGLICCFACIIAGYWIGQKSMLNFQTAHPEMKYVRDWQIYFGNADKYPATLEQKKKIEQYVITLLVGLQQDYIGAQRAYTNFREATHRYSPENCASAPAERMMKKAEEVVSESRTLCQQAIDLCIVKLAIVRDCDTWEKFCEKFHEEIESTAVTA